MFTAHQESALFLSNSIAAIVSRRGLQSLFSLFTKCKYTNECILLLCAAISIRAGSRASGGGKNLQVSLNGTLPWLGFQPETYKL